jgi:hypothetical protein
MGGVECRGGEDVIARPTALDTTGLDGDATAAGAEALSGREGTGVRLVPVEGRISGNGRSTSIPQDSEADSSGSGRLHDYRWYGRPACRVTECALRAGTLIWLLYTALDIWQHCDQSLPSSRYSCPDCA